VEKPLSIKPVYNIIRKGNLAGLFLSLVVLIIFFTAAGDQAFGQGVTVDNPLGGNDDFNDIADSIATWIFNIAIPIAVIFIVYAGIRFVMARGNPGEVGKAKSVLGWAIVGLIIVIIGRGFITLIEDILSL
jgi:hypothetical protein